MSNSNDKFIYKSLCRYAEWRAWWELVVYLFQAKNFLGSDKPCGTFVGNSVEKFLKENFNIETYNSEQVFTAMIEIFHFGEVINEPYNKPGQGTVKFSTQNDLFGKINVCYNARSGGAPRKRSVIFHEIGHIFCKLCWEAMALNGLDKYIPKSNSKQEQWCWDFSLQILCPYEKRRKWSPETLDSIRRETTKLYNSENSLPFSFKDLLDLARYETLSIRATIKSLNYLPLLEQLHIGIAVISLARSNKHKENFALRIHQKATPIWGYIIPNQRIIWQGFLKAPDAFRQLENMESIVVDDILKPQYRLTNQKNKYTKQGEVILNTKIEYTAIDTKNEGRFLIAIWDWPTYGEYCQKKAFDN